MMPTRPKRILYLSVVVSFFFFGVITIKNSPTPLVYAAPCGNGICQSSQGEDCNTCPADCGACPTSPPTPTPTPPPPTPTPTGTSTPAPTGTATPVPTGSTPTPTDPGGTTDTDSSTSSSTSDSSGEPEPTPVNTTPPTISSLPSIPTTPTDQQIITISGTVTQTVDPIVSVEVSLDNGLSWSLANLSGSRYSYTTDELEDGNYPVRIRVTDSNGNSVTSNAQILIIDVLPPLIGGSLVSSGPMVLSASTDGVTTLAKNSSTKYIFSTKGGVVEGTISVGDRDFEITQIPKTNLFWTDLNLPDEGYFEIKASVKDGADQVEERTLSTVLVKSSGKITSKKNDQPLSDIRVSVFVFEKDQNDWALWNGGVFGQENPTTTDKGGNYAFMLPKGRYYVEVNNKAYKKARSEIFEVEKTNLVDFDFALTPLTQIKVFSFELFLPSLTPPNSFAVGLDDLTSNNKNQSGLINESVPDLLSSKTKKADIDNYLENPLIISFVSSWSANSQDQIFEIEKALATNPGLNILVVFVQDSPSFVSSFMKRGNYSFDYIVDESGFSAKNFEVTTLPQNFVVKDETIQDVVYNTIGYNDIINKLESY